MPVFDCYSICNTIFEIAVSDKEQDAIREVVLKDEKFFDKCQQGI